MTPDGKHLVYLVAETQSDVWMMEHFDPESEIETPRKLEKWLEGELLVQLQKGWSLIRQRQYVEAEKIFHEGLDLHPDHAGFLNGMRVTVLESNKHEEAKRYSEKLLAIEVALTLKRAVHSSLGSIGILLNDYNYAEKHFRNALTIDSTHTQAIRGMGYLFAVQENWAEADKYALQALALDSSFANYNLAGWVLVSGEIDLDRGIAFAEKALNSKPENWAHGADVYSYLAIPEHTIGLAYLKKDEYEKAVQYLEQAAAFAPQRQAIRDDLQRARGKLAGK